MATSEGLHPSLLLKDLSISEGKGAEGEEVGKGGEEVGNFPVKIGEGEVVVGEEKLSVKVVVFSNKVMILLTKNGRIGTWIEAKGEESQSGDISFSLKPLLGDREDPIPTLVARQLIQFICSKKLPKSLLFGANVRGIDMKKHLPAVKEEIIRLL